ncbi:MAG: hypothetical protein R2734_12800 [Nocardioides sp.]
MATPGRARRPASPYVEPHLARRRARVPHPVHDFLFDYYSQRPAQLTRWHPGYGTALAGEAAAAYASGKGYARGPDGSVAVTAAYARSQRPLVTQIHELLAATAKGDHRASAAWGCTSGRWSTGCPRAAAGTTPGRCGSAGRVPTPSWRPAGSPARPSAPSGSSPSGWRPLNTLGPATTTGRRSSSQAACTRPWICTSTPSGSPLVCSEARRRRVRAGLGGAHPRHARGAVRPQRAHPRPHRRPLDSRSHRDTGGQAGVRRRPARVRRPGGAAACPAPGSLPLLDDG